MCAFVKGKIDLARQLAALISSVSFSFERDNVNKTCPSIAATQSRLIINEKTEGSRTSGQMDMLWRN